MKNPIIYFLMFMIFALTPALAQVKKASTDLTPYVGYRYDNIKWTVKDGASFQWKNLSSINYGFNGMSTFKDRYLLRYDIGLANILGGHLNDNRYLIPGTPATSSSFKGWGMAFRPNIGLGYKFKPTRLFNLEPQLGFSYDLIYINNNKNSGPFSSVKNTIQWYGPWLGLDAIYKIKRFTLDLGAFYYLAFYKNSGNWKVTAAPVKNTMSQHGTGQGFTCRLGGSYEIVKSMSVGANADILWRQVRNGHDSRTFDSLPAVKEKLTKVKWTSVTGNLTFTKSF